MSTAVAAAQSTHGKHPMTDGKLAMWLFLASEAMFFAGLFGAYIVLRISNPGMAFHPDALNELYHSKLNIPLATLNTAILITSSFTMVLAVDGAHKHDTGKIRKWLMVTAVLGIAFCVVKGIEYNAKFSHNVYPDTSIFYSLYFLITGIHAAHVIGGIIPFLYMAMVAGDGRYAKSGSTTIELWGLYWHFVDLVWIFLFPTLYLIR